jgi:hypothetical protein
MLPESAENTELNAEEASLVDRRSYYRARLGNSLLRVRAWRIAPGTPLGHAPMPSQEVRFSVHNVCIGGLGIVLANATAQPPLTLTDRLRIEVFYDQDSILIEGRLRTPDAAQREPYSRTGIRFDGHSSNLGYQKARFWMSKVMGRVQREELKARRSAEEQAKDAGNIPLQFP